MDFLVGNEVDAILSDISLPGMGGKELCRWLHERRPNNRPRMIAYTAFAMPHQRQSILDAGFDALVVKPAKLETILDAIDPDRNLMGDAE
jgi:CheY-like chemotaxis protein